jgi:hypothetical protein
MPGSFCFHDFIVNDQIALKQILKKQASDKRVHIEEFFPRQMVS